MAWDVKGNPHAITPHLLGVSDFMARASSLVGESTGEDRVLVSSLPHLLCDLEPVS